MCGIACYLGSKKEEGFRFGTNAIGLLKHRGPDDNGIFNADEITLAHTRLSILELSSLGHQPMWSSCGRYVIAYNGEIYNHLELRKKYLVEHQFKGHSDTETIIELFRLRKEQILNEMVGMWAIIIWDTETKQLFISRDRYGQKPLYTRLIGDSWYLSSEIRPLLSQHEKTEFNATALVEYLALGNYGHLGIHTFYDNIQQFPEGHYAWLKIGQKKLETKKYWELPFVDERDKIPFDAAVKKELHDSIVEAVLSQTISDVPIGITLSGGIDSSIISGILSRYYNQEINIFTAQSVESKYDETKYVNAVIKMNRNNNFKVHTKNLNELSVKETLENYINIQEEPFGDPSIIAHGFLMKMAADAGVKVILNGQGADELFFGYNNMAQAILSEQLKSLQLNKFYSNLRAMKLGNKYLLRALLESSFPGLEYNLRTKSRIKRRDILQKNLLQDVDNSMISLHKYNNAYNVWTESVYGVHIPHLVHYDDRNGMAYSIEGRMPFLDHRIAELVARIKTNEFMKKGMRKYILREACKEYIPAEVYNRRDKIGFYTPLIDALNKDAQWVVGQLKESKLFRADHNDILINKLQSGSLNVNEALQIWRGLSAYLWMKLYNINGLH